MFNNAEFPWIICRLDREYFAISTMLVESLIELKTVTPIPYQPAFIRGVINSRGRLIQLLDLRIRLKMRSLAAELHDFDEMLNARRADHERWLGELKRSTEAGEAFGLTTDPHKCAFGKWYDSFQTKDNTLAQLLMKFDAPHKEIHAIADKVESLKRAGEIGQAIEIIEHCWNHELRTMIDLFEVLKRAYRESKPEIALILDGERRRGLIVDEVLVVEPLEPKGFTPLEELAPHWVAGAESGGLCSAKRRGDNSIVLALTLPHGLFGDGAESTLELAQVN